MRTNDVFSYVTATTSFGSKLRKYEKQKDHCHYFIHLDISSLNRLEALRKRNGVPKIEDEVENRRLHKLT